MTSMNYSSLPDRPLPDRRPFWIPSRQTLPLIVTLLVCVAMYSIACYRYESFRTAQVFVDLLSNNATLGIAAIGMTFVILSGGIDLSVGTAIGCTGMIIASLVETYHFHPLTAALIAIIIGTLVGLTQGALITFFELQPFLVTLGGLFLYRGIGLLISRLDISINHPWYETVSNYRFIPQEGTEIPIVAIAFIALLIVMTCFARWRPAGRAVYAIGGNEQSALLMGLPVKRIKIGVYAFSGFCAALAGVIATFTTPSGNPLRGTGVELDTIAAVVIGGTLLSGGVGGPIGTLLGVIIFGIIDTAIAFEGTLSSWWARIVVGLLLLAFVLLQTLLQPRETHS